MTDLEKAFTASMWEIFQRAKAECGYTASRFSKMLQDHQGPDTARILLDATGVSEGYTALWERKRLDLTIEAYVLRPEFKTLFSSKQLETARQRLKDYGYEAR
jgi:hypothetical protein